MLSKAEKRYIEDIGDFEFKYGTDNAKAVRHRIRKKIQKGLLDLILVIEKDEKGRRPADERRNRKNKEVLEQIESGKIAEKDTKLEMMGIQLRNMFNMGILRKTTSLIITPIWILDMIEAYVRKNPWRGDMIKEIIERVERERKQKTREKLMEMWNENGGDWVTEHLKVCFNRYSEAGFETKEECIAWLKRSVIRVKES